MDEMIEQSAQGTEEKRNDEKVVKARHLKKSFGEKAVIKDVSFDLSQKENLAIMGKSGTGKSVLIKCLVGLLAPDGGELEVLGYDLMNIAKEEMEKLRWDVGYLFQGGALYDSMTVERNLKFSLRRNPEKKHSEAEINDLVDEVLENVGLINTKRKMPAELSGGMKKRIALARTLIMKPKIMLYDEPTTGLDIITSNEISELMLEMREKYEISSIIITHDIACVEKTADRIMILDDGGVLIDGDAGEVSTNDDKKIRAYFKGE
ncbi:MAG: ATP-binding cassette domain-containing protein [Cyclobacteriaceae bacterium]|nr:ATP-binding cassette domain-containing protein [Cyclobacteriaceae bacterium]